MSGNTFLLFFLIKNKPQHYRLRKKIMKNFHYKETFKMQIKVLPSKLYSLANHQTPVYLE